MNVPVKSHFGGINYYPLVRITKAYIVVRWNDVATGKFRRDSGFSVGAFRDRQSLTPNKIPDESLAELNKLAEDNGGTFDAEKRGAK